MLVCTGRGGLAIAESEGDVRRGEAVDGQLGVALQADRLVAGQAELDLVGRPLNLDQLCRSRHVPEDHRPEVGFVGPPVLGVRLHHHLRSGDRGHRVRPASHRGRAQKVVGLVGGGSVCCVGPAVGLQQRGVDDAEGRIGDDEWDSGVGDRRDENERVVIGRLHGRDPVEEVDGVVMKVQEPVVCELDVVGGQWSSVGELDVLADRERESLGVRRNRVGLGDQRDWCRGIPQLEGEQTVVDGMEERIGIEVDAAPTGVRVLAEVPRVGVIDDKRLARHAVGGAPVRAGREENREHAQGGYQERAASLHQAAAPPPKPASRRQISARNI